LLPIKPDDTELTEIPPKTGYLQGDTPLIVAITIAKKLNTNLDIELMLSWSSVKISDSNFEKIPAR